MRIRVTSFLAGFAAAGTHAAVSRLLAPFFGLGPYLQTVLAAVALLATATGLALCARADRSSRAVPGPALAASGAWLALALWARRPLLLALEPLGLRLDAAIASLLLLAPPLVFLGALIPWAAREEAQRGPDAGNAAGRAGATVLVGAAAAALLVPFLLLPWLGATGVGLALGALQIVAGLWSGRPHRRAAALTSTVLVLALTALVWGPARRATAGVRAHAQTGAAELRVLERDGALYLLADGSIHAVVVPTLFDGLRRPEAALGLVRLLRPEPGRALILGLRGGSLARRFADLGWNVDVVEPDSVAVRLSHVHLGMRPRHARQLAAEPRAHLRASRERYDVVVLDVFASNFVPPELVTRECFAEAARLLRPGGLFALVVESQGWDDPLVRSLAATARTSFATVLALPTGEPPNALGSVVLLAGERELEIRDEALPVPFEHLTEPLAHWNAIQQVHAWANRFEPSGRGAIVLTDDRNPAELWGERINLAARRELHGYFGPRGGSW